MTHPRKQRDPGKGLSPKAHQSLTQISPSTGSGPTLKKSGEMSNWWWEFWSICYQGAEPINDTQVQDIASRQAVAFRLPLAQLEKSG